MTHGGKRKGAGRPVGAKNKLTEEIVKAVKESGDTPLEFILSIYRDEERSIDIRIDAAKAALPYVHGKMSTQLEHSGEVDSKVVHLSAEEATAISEALEDEY